MKQEKAFPKPFPKRLVKRAMWSELLHLARQAQQLGWPYYSWWHRAGGWRVPATEQQVSECLIEIEKELERRGTFPPDKPKTRRDKNPSREPTKAELESAAAVFGCPPDPDDQIWGKK
jgi:hypothetical protein